MSAPKILAFGGSLRADSFNQKLVSIAAGAAREAGAEVTLLRLSDYPLAVYNGDDEERDGLPANAVKLKKLFIESDGFLISSPEYNSSISAALKNTIDWVSRPAPNEPPLAGFAGKAAALMSASPGALGGLRGLVHVRAILGNIRVIVLPDQMAINSAHEAFDDRGALRDTSKQEIIRGLGRGLAEFLKKHR
ncbi:MAG: NAD(P)H-dependent oxidoreductase [Phycisphaerales bacterium]|nr:NAD(P)H-dependent oxidoreductase [Phycisphaerales bacterium]